MQNPRAYLWAGIAIVVAAALTVILSQGDGDRSKAARLQALAKGGVARFVAAEAPQPAPTLAFKVGPEGTGDAALSDYRGRVVLLNLWATWCAPCVEELPSLDRLQAARGADDFTVLAISLDRGGTDKVVPFLGKLGITHLDVVTDPKSAGMRAFEVYSLPTTVLIGADGRVLGRAEGPGEWDGDDAQALVEAALAPID